MSFISFNWDKHFIFAIIYWALEICVRLHMYIQWDYFSMSKCDVQNEYIFVILLNISDLLSIFLVLYIKCAFRRKKDVNNKLTKENTGGVELIYKDIENSKSHHFWKKMILVSLLSYFSRSLYWISYAISGANNEEVSHQLQKDVVNTFDILMRYIFSIFILRTIIHKHRILSITLIFCGFVILLPADFLLINGKDEISMTTTLFYVGILVLRSISLPLEDTIIKQLLSDSYILPEYLMFLRGIFEAIIIICITPILYYSFGIKWAIYFEKKHITTIIVYTLSSFVKSYFLIKIIYHFSSQSVSFLVISESITGSINEIIEFIKDENKEPLDILLLILEMIGILIIAFATLLYDEVIIIKKWKLDENVKSGIISRGEEDMIKLKELELARISTFDENNSPTENIISPQEKSIVDDINYEE